MNDHFLKVKEYLLQLNHEIIREDEGEGLFVIRNEGENINNLFIGVADPILIMEQHIMDFHNGSEDNYRKLLMKNRDIVHGAFVLDGSGKRLIFRDTLQLKNLDFNELEGSINSLSLLLSEYSEELLEMSKS